MTVNKETMTTEEVLMDTLESINCLIEAHKGYVELGEVTEARAVIFCGGQCARCDEKCIEDAIKERLPDLEIVFL